jgi:hypothetical protein
MARISVCFAFSLRLQDEVRFPRCRRVVLAHAVVTEGPSHIANVAHVHALSASPRFRSNIQLCRLPSCLLAPLNIIIEPHLRIVMMINTSPPHSDDASEHPPNTNTTPGDTQGVQSPEPQRSTVPSRSSQPLTETTSGHPSAPNQSVPGSVSEFLTPTLRTPGNITEGAGGPPDGRPPVSRI